MNTNKEKVLWLCLEGGGLELLIPIKWNFEYGADPIEGIGVAP